MLGRSPCSASGMNELDAFPLQFCLFQTFTPSLIFCACFGCLCVLVWHSLSDNNHIRLGFVNIIEAIPPRFGRTKYKRIWDCSRAQAAFSQLAESEEVIWPLLFCIDASSRAISGRRFTPGPPAKLAVIHSLLNSDNMVEHDLYLRKNMRPKNRKDVLLKNRRTQAGLFGLFFLRFLRSLATAHRLAALFRAAFTLPPTRGAVFHRDHLMACVVIFTFFITTRHFFLLARAVQCSMYANTPTRKSDKGVIALLPMVLLFPIVSLRSGPLAGHGSSPSRDCSQAVSLSHHKTTLPQSGDESYPAESLEVDG